MANSRKDAVSEQALSGTQRAAVIITGLGLEAAAVIFKSLSEEEVAEIAEAVERVREIPEEVRQKTLADFRAQLRGGAPKEALDLRTLLERSLGADKAAQVFANTQTDHAGHFAFLNKLAVPQAFELLQNERPQVLALALCHLDSKHAAAILAHFDVETQTRAVMRMGRMQPVVPELVARVAGALHKKAHALRPPFRTAGGPKRIADVLNHVDRGTSRQILDTLQTQDADLLDDVKKLMLVFDDLATLSPKAMQVILRQVDLTDLALALKGAADELKHLIFGNLSKRAAERLQEEMELQGPRPKKEIEEARARIVAVVRRLEEEGKIEIMRGTDDELVA